MSGSGPGGFHTMAANGARIGLAAVALTVVLATPSAAAVRWVTGYYAAYSEAGVGLTPADVDYTALTHVIHWPVLPRVDGTVNTNLDMFGLTPAQSSEVISRAHAAGAKALLGFGGDAATVGLGWQGATSPANRATFIANMVNLMQARGYDGIDINWEELTLGDQAQFTALVNELRAALDAINPRPLLTVVPTSGSDVPVTLIAPLQSKFDQINIQTYVMSGPYPGWITWFNSPIFNGGQMFPGGGLVPSADNEVDRFTGGGIPVGNLGIGIQFDGAVWTGGSGMATGGPSQPRQPLNDADPPTMTFMRTADIIATFTPPDFIKTFDTVAKVPWIGRDAPGAANDTFISFDDEQAIQEKASYIAQKGLGGVFVFELSGDFFPAATGDARHPLLAAVRNSFPLQTSAPTLSLGLNQSTFGPGETLILTATLSPGSTPTTVDAYAVLRLADGTFLSLLLGGRVVLGIVPIVSGFTPFSFTGEIFRYTFTGGEPPGTHRWLSGLTVPGTLNTLGTIDQDPFTVVP